MRGIRAFAFLFIAVVFCLVGCSQDTPVKTGTLEININADVSRGIQAISMETESYNVTVKDSSENVVFSSTGKAQTSYSIKVVAGTYTVNVEALNSDGDVIGTGSANATVAAGQVNSFSITVSEVVGNGTFSISITANEGYPLSYSIKNALGTEIKSGSLAYEDGAYSASESLANGFYTFIITRTDSSKVLKYDSVRIISGKTASYSASFQFLTDGTIVIVNEITTTPTIIISLSATTLQAGDTLTATATISGITDEACYWVLDGVALSDAKPYEDLEYVIAESDEGEHEIALFATDNTKVWSESKTFIVGARSYPTSVMVSGDIEVFVTSNVLVPRSTKLDIDIKSSMLHRQASVWCFHIYETLDEETEITVGNVSEEGYFAYIETEYDNTNNRTIVYVVIDKDIENPAYLTLKFQHEFVLGDGQTVGPRIHKMVDGESVFDGMIMVSNSKEDRTLKVEPGDYEYYSNYGSNASGYYIDVAPESFTTEQGETTVLTLTSRPFGTLNITAPSKYDYYQVYDNGSRLGMIEKGEVYSISGLVDDEYSLMLVPVDSENITSYYSCSGTFVEGENQYSLEEADLSFVDSGLTVSGENIAIEYAYNAVLPRYSTAFLKIGDDIVTVDGVYEADYEESASDASISVALFSGLDGYSIVPSVTGSTITLTYDLAGDESDYATLNIVFDDFTPDSEYAKCYPNLDKDEGSGGVRYEIPVGPTTLKILPGRYRGNGCWGRGGNSYSYAPRGWFTVEAGDEYELHLTCNSN